MCLSSFLPPETDMFFLAISMVGTDFSLIGRLFPHRARAEIKVKTLKQPLKFLFALSYCSFAVPMPLLLVLIIFMLIGSAANWFNVFF